MAAMNGRDISERIASAHHRFIAASVGGPALRLEREMICGDWSARDIAAHVAAWNVEMLSAARAALGQIQAPAHHPIADGEAFNQEQARANAGRTWSDVVAWLDATVRDAVILAEPLGEADMARPVTFPWGGTGTLGDLMGGFDGHAVEHVADLERSSAAWRGVR